MKLTEISTNTEHPEQITNALGTLSIEIPEKPFDAMLHCAEGGDVRGDAGFYGLAILAIPLVFCYALTKYSRRNRN